MKKTKKCPKCGSAEIISDAEVQGSEGLHAIPVEVATFRKPDALVFRERQWTRVFAWVCVGCGYLELYAENPRALRSPGAP